MFVFYLGGLGRGERRGMESGRGRGRGGEGGKEGVTIFADAGRCECRNGWGGHDGYHLEGVGCVVV